MWPGGWRAGPRMKGSLGPLRPAGLRSAGAGGNGCGLQGWQSETGRMRLVAARLLLRQVETRACQLRPTGGDAAGHSPPARRAAQLAGSMCTSSPISSVHSEPNTPCAAATSWPHIQHRGAPPARRWASSASGKTTTCTWVRPC